jgi:hypothetical protein
MKYSQSSSIPDLSIKMNILELMEFSLFYKFVTRIYEYKSLHKIEKYWNCPHVAKWLQKQHGDKNLIQQYITKVSHATYSVKSAL